MGVNEIGKVIYFVVDDLGLKARGSGHARVVASRVLTTQRSSSEECFATSCLVKGAFMVVYWDEVTFAAQNNRRN